MKKNSFFILALAFGIVPITQTMEYSGPPDKQPTEKNGKEEIVEVEEVEQAPADMLKMISNDDQEFFVGTQVAQESPQIASVLEFKIQHSQDLIYKSDLSSKELQTLIALLRLQHASPRLIISDVDKIDTIFEPLTAQEQKHLLQEALNYFELAIAAFYTAWQLAEQKLTKSIKETANDITDHTNLQNMIIKYYELMNPNQLLLNKENISFSIQDLIDFNRLPEVENNKLNLNRNVIKDMTGFENLLPLFPGVHIIWRQPQQNNKRFIIMSR